jgi:hypothetical protein
LRQVFRDNRSFVSVTESYNSTFAAVDERAKEVSADGFDGTFPVDGRTLPSLAGTLLAKPLHLKGEPKARIE